MHRLTQAVVSATHKLKISQSELSRRLGKSRNYISNMLDGCSTAKQGELIDMINRVSGGEIFKSDDAIIAELSEKLENAHQLAQHNHDCAHKYLNQVHEYKAEIKQQKSEIHNLKETIDRCDDAYGILQKRHEDAMDKWANWQRSQNQTQILLNQSEENSLYWMNKVPKTAMQALKLFFKLLFGGKA